MQTSRNTVQLAVWGLRSVAQAVVFLSSQDAYRRQNHALVFLRPLRGFSLEGFRTQGSASLHPWATIRRRFAAQKALSEQH